MAEVPNSEFAEHAAEAVALLKAVANQSRLLILCHLAAHEELPVGALVASVGLSQSALSQHLAKLRAQGLVATRKVGQSVHYRIRDAKAARLLGLMHELYCPALGAEPTGDKAETNE